MNKIPPKTLITAIAACLLGVVLALVEAELPADTAFIEALTFWLTIACTAAFLLTTIGAAIDYLVVRQAWRVAPMTGAGNREAKADREVT